MAVVRALPQPSPAGAPLRRQALRFLAAALAVGSLFASRQLGDPSRPLLGELAYSKLEWYRKRGGHYSKKEKERIRIGQSSSGVKLIWPRDGRRLGPDDTNVGVQDTERLAADPLPLRLDRTGKIIKAGETVDAIAPWSMKDVGGRSSAAAPMSWEEFDARYRRMDKPMESAVSDLALKDLKQVLTKEDGRDDYRTVRTFSFQGEDGSGPSTIMLIGVTELSARSRSFAARAVYEVEPSALMVQLCHERIGRHLVMPEEHLATVANYARGYAASNPHGLRRELYVCDAVNGDYEALKLWMGDMAYGRAVDEFLEAPQRGSVPKTLCLGDVRKSRLEWLRKKQGNETLQSIPTLSARGKHLARGLIALTGLGHQVVLGIVDVDLLATTTTWLERAGARLLAVADTSDIEGGRESLAADAQLGLTAKPAPGRSAGASSLAAAQSVLGFGTARLGAFLSEEAMRVLQQRKRRLAKLTRVKDLVKHVQPPKVWKVAELLGGEGPTPGPGALLREPRGLRFEFEKLEIPDHYLRDAGMEVHAQPLWDSLEQRGLAIETRDATELMWWAAGATEVSSEGPGRGAEAAEY